MARLRLSVKQRNTSEGQAPGGVPLQSGDASLQNGSQYDRPRAAVPLQSSDQLGQNGSQYERSPAAESPGSLSPLDA
jgi:hypothetical protein